MKLDEQIAIFLDHVRYDEDRPLKVGEKSHPEQLKQLIRDVVEHVKPERWSVGDVPSQILLAEAHNEAIDEMELSIWELGLSEEEQS